MERLLPIQDGSSRGWESRYGPFWLLWIACCLAILIIHSYTIDVYQPVNQDEVQILDLGRTALDPESDWALTWDVKREQAVLPIYYLGPAFQEFAYQFSAPSNLGPRMLAICSAILAATVMLGWFIARGVHKWIAFIVALALLLDPMFADTYRQGRIDGWPIAACLLSCWLLASAKNNLGQSQICNLQLFFAGSAFALSPFLWPSAFILAPLVLLEFFLYLKSARFMAVGSRWLKAIQIIWPFLVGGAVTLMVLLVPVVMRWDNYWQGLEGMTVVQSAAAKTQIPIHQLFLVYDPLIFLTAIFALFISRSWTVLFSLAFAIASIQGTMIYQARIIYLLPYLCCIIAAAWQLARFDQKQQLKLRVLEPLVISCCIWGAVIVLVMRPMTAHLQKPENQIDQVHDALSQVIKPGPSKVLLEEWSGYYAGRDLGWKMYLAGVLTSTEEYRGFLEKMDYVIVRKNPITHFRASRLVVELGFEEIAVLNFPESRSFRLSLGFTHINISSKSFPAVRIYRNSIRKGHTLMHNSALKVEPET